MCDVVGTVSLSLTLLGGSIKALRTISGAVRYDQDVETFCLKLDLQQHALSTWADAAGLLQVPPTLRINANDAPFVPRILAQLEGSLADLAKLRKRYGLHLVKEAPDDDGIGYADPARLPNDDDAAAGGNGSRSALGKLSLVSQALIERANAALFKGAAGTWRVLRWVAIDVEKAEKLLETIKEYVAHLEKFLEQPMRAQREAAMDGVLRGAVINANDERKLDVFGRGKELSSPRHAIASAARLKKTVLKLGALEPISPRGSWGIANGSRPTSREAGGSPLAPSRSWSHSSQDMRLRNENLTISRLGRGQNVRTLAYFDSKVVLLEWKTDVDIKSKSLESRVNQVAAFLNVLDTTFHSLPCRGYVKDHEYGRYGYIFDVPDHFQQLGLPESPSPGKSFSSYLPKMQTLRQFLDQPSNEPSLNSKLRIALTLLETTLNLHTAGWLHKELRSDNIIFIRDSHDDLRINNTSLIFRSSIYIAGYVYARTDDPSELTEPLASDIESNLYRHPLSLGNSRLSYCKGFDLFSVGCTLLEIGLWSSMREILMRHSQRTPPVEAQIQRLAFSQRTATSASAISGATLIEDDDDNASPTEELCGQDVQTIDLMRLRHEMLAQFLDLDSSPDPIKLSESLSDTAIFGSLKAALGLQYANMVEGLLSVPVAVFESCDDATCEHEYVLDLEMKACNTIKAIINVI